MTNNKPGVVSASIVVAACATVVGVTVDGSTAAAVVSSPIHRYTLINVR